MDLTLFNVNINRKSGYSAYRQIYDVYKRQIITGNIQPGVVFPAENKLGETLHVNRITLRRAIKLLETDGLVKKKMGRGTFVQERSYWNGKKNNPVLGIIIKAKVLDYHYRQLYADISLNAISLGMNIKTFQESPDTFSTLPERIRSEMVQGIISFHILDKEFLEQMARISVPRLMLEWKCKLDGMDNVGIDSSNGLHEGITELIRLGHSDIAFIGGLNQIRDKKGILKLQITPDNMERQSAYRMSLEEHGIDFRHENCHEVSFCQEDSDDLVRKLMEQNRLSTALVCYNDEIAVFMLNSLKKHGLSVPEDISIVGFGNFETAAMENRLATIEVDYRKMAETAVQRIHERMKNGGIEGMSINMKTRFKSGSSIGPAKKAGAKKQNSMNSTFQTGSTATG